MPNRIIKESICTSDSIDGLSWFEEAFFYRLIVNCDDYGRFDGRPAVIKSRLFPLKDNVTAKSVEAAIQKLASVELVALYEFEGKPYLHLPTWDKHQQVRAQRSKYPAPEDGTYTSDINCNQMKSDAPVIQSESNPNPNPNPKANARDVFLDFAGENESLLEALKSFEAMRKTIKAPLTDRGKKTLLTSLKALSLDPETQVKIIDQSTTNCWKGFFALKENKMNPRGPVTRTAVDDMSDLERRMVQKFKNKGPLLDQTNDAETAFPP